LLFLLLLTILPGSKDVIIAGQETLIQMENKLNEKQFDKEFDLMAYIINSIISDTRTTYVEFIDSEK
jgi:hypothetical protein